MFPLNFNSLFRKSNGELTTLGKMFENSGGSYTLPTASTSTKGGIKIGSGLTMDGETLNNDNPTPYTLPTAGAETKGGIKIGSGLTMDGDTLNNDNPTQYTLPTASASTKGGVKVGSGLTMDGDTLNNNNPTPYDDTAILSSISAINSMLSIQDITSQCTLHASLATYTKVFKLAKIIMISLVSSNDITASGDYYELLRLPNNYNMLSSRLVYFNNAGTSSFCDLACDTNILKIRSSGATIKAGTGTIFLMIE